MRKAILILMAVLFVCAAVRVTSGAKEVLREQRQEIVELRDSLLNEPYSEELRQATMQLVDFDRQFSKYL